MSVPILVKADNLQFWAAIMIGSGFMTNYGGLLTTRLLIGFCEAGMFPYLNIYCELSSC